MSFDPNSAIGQAETANDKLAQYFSDMNKFVGDNTGSILPPDFQDIINSFDYSELLRMTISRAGDSASFENGAAIENIHHMVAIMREYSLRQKGKIDYYSDAETDFLDESNFYSTLKVFWVNMLSGFYEEGKTS
jgi:hypothetical protein